MNELPSPSVNAGPVSFEVDPEGIQEMGPSVMFPLNVYDPQGNLWFQHPVMIRAEFYRQLMTLPEGRRQLLDILKNRLRRELSRRHQPPTLSIRERMDLWQPDSRLTG